MSLVIKNFKLASQGSRIAIFDVEVSNLGLQVRDMILLEKNNRRWVNFPSRIREQDGRNIYVSVVEFLNPDHNKKFQEEVFKLAEEEYQKFISAKTSSKVIHDAIIENSEACPF